MLNIFIIIFTSFSLVADESAVEKYCFSSKEEMLKAKAELKTILLPSDSLTMGEECLSIGMRPHRRELIQSYVRNIAPTVSIAFSSAEVKREPCLLKVEKVMERNHEELNANISGFPNINLQSGKTQAKNISTLQTLGSFELTVNQDVIKGNCRFITPRRYEISLEVRKDPKPQISPWIPKEDEETSFLKTELQLEKGSRVEIGSVVKNLREKSGEIDSAKGGEIKRDAGKQSEKVFLSLD